MRAGDAVLRAISASRPRSSALRSRAKRPRAGPSDQGDEPSSVTAGSRKGCQASAGRIEQRAAQPCPRRGEVNLGLDVGELLDDDSTSWVAEMAFPGRGSREQGRRPEATG